MPLSLKRMGKVARYTVYLRINFYLNVYVFFVSFFISVPASKQDNVEILSEINTRIRGAEDPYVICMSDIHDILKQGIYKFLDSNIKVSSLQKTRIAQL